MSKKGNIPSIRDLRDELATHKKDIQEPGEVRYIRIIVHESGHIIAAGASPHIHGDVGPSIKVLAEVYTQVERSTNSQVLAKELVAKLRAAMPAPEPSPPWRPGELGEEPGEPAEAAPPA
jgi:hypothetical protein